MKRLSAAAGGRGQPGVWARPTWPGQPSGRATIQSFVQPCPSSLLLAPRIAPGTEKAQIIAARTSRIPRPRLFPFTPSLPPPFNRGASRKHRNKMPEPGASRFWAVAASERQAAAPDPRLPLCVPALKVSLMKAVSNTHLKSSIQKITKSWPFIILDPSHCNENMYLTGKTQSLHSPWPLLPFFSLPLRARDVRIHLSPAPGSSELQAQRARARRGPGESAPRLILHSLSGQLCLFFDFF